MSKATAVLFSRQRNGSITRFRNLARNLSLGAKEALDDLVKEHWEGRILLGRWPKEEINSETIVFAVPLVPEALPTDCSLEELQWPQLTSELLRGNFAARIHLFNRLHKPVMQGKAIRNYSWEEQMEYLYQNLALSAFGETRGWKKEWTFNTEWPATQEELDRLVTLPTKKQVHSPVRRSTYIRPTDDIPEVRPQLSPESASKLHPEGYISITELVAKANAMKISTSKIAKAIGGDRGLEPVRNENWRQFLIGRKRYVSNNALEELPKMVAGHNDDPK